MANNYNRKTSKAIKKFGPAVFRKILPDKEIQAIAEKYGGDIRRRKLPTVVHLWLLVMASFETGCISMEMLLHKTWEGLRELLDLPPGKSVDKSALSRKNSHRSPMIFKEVFQLAVKKYNERFKNDLNLPEIGLHLAIIDSTVSNIAGRLYRWFKNGGKHKNSGRAQVKSHVLLDGDSGIPLCVDISRGSVADQKRARNLVIRLQEPCLLLFDRGYCGHDFFRWLLRSGHEFVTRLKENVRYETIKRLGKGDCLIKLLDTRHPLKLRLVTIKSESGEKIHLLTSLIDVDQFPSSMIAELYIKRWQIEIFFRDMKHILRYQQFFSYSANGIRLHIYAALIAYVLVKYLIAAAAEKEKIDKNKFCFKAAVSVLTVWLSINPRRLYAASRKETAKQWNALLLNIDEHAGGKKTIKKSQAGRLPAPRAA